MKKLKFIFTTLIVGATVNVSVLLSLTVYRRHSRLNRLESEWCSINLEITNRGNPDLLGQLIVKTDKNTNRNETCGNLSTMLKIVVGLNIHESYDSDVNPELLALAVEVFNCTVAQQNESTMQIEHVASQEKPVPGAHTRLFWNHVTQTAHHVIFKQEDGDFQIRESGFYFVSSLLTVRAQNMTSTDSMNGIGDTMSHVVNVIHKNGTEQVLLENIKSMCELTSGHADWSSNLGAAFYLNEEDRLFVGTSHPYNIATGHSNNYFSIHAIL